MNGSRRATAVPHARASRAVRTLRGTIGAIAATLFAAASHALAGGDLTLLGVVATGIIALPLCVLLAGRIGSLWRLAVAVGTAQFIYHWAFAGLGASSGTAGAEPAPLHAAHLAAIESFTPTAMAASADAIMWLGHAAGALVTIALLHRGERAVVALLDVVSRAIPRALQMLPVPIGRPVSPPARAFTGSPLRDRLLTAAAITHRGPPLTV